MFWHEIASLQVVLPLCQKLMEDYDPIFLVSLCLVQRSTLEYSESLTAA